jgi:acyl-CoA synthetase (NDP forming)
MMALYGLFADRDLGLSHLISLGNQVDVTLADSLSYLVQEANTAVIGAFVEGVQNGRAFAAALQAALIAGKPIVLVKSGRTALGQAAAATHTAALAGSDRVFTAVCQQYGVIQVDDVDEMVETMTLLAAFGPKLQGQRVSLVTQSGGMGSLTADMCYQLGFTLPPLSKKTEAQLHALPHLLHFDALGNPADVRGAGVIGSATGQTLAPFLSDPDTDMVVLLLAKSTLRAGEDETAQAIIQAATLAEKPLIVVWVGQRDNRAAQAVDEPLTGVNRPVSARDLLIQAGIPVFDSSRQAIKALAYAQKYWQFRTTWLADPELPHREGGNA